MKTLAALALMTLTCFLFHSSEGQVGIEVWRQEMCCNSYNKARVPVTKIKQMRRSPGHCKLEAIVITTVTNRKFCKNPCLTEVKTMLEKRKQTALLNQIKC
uniref:C-C motif chemokine 17-like n=1 Tax=Monopterus albus TaxID=43700 RepID=UPI0009B4B930|nr:C-C motif chemokine 17-like [Monopterus albus]